MVMETRWGEETMTSELKVAYEELLAENNENALEELCKEFCNFPEESIRQIICENKETIDFEW